MGDQPFPESVINMGQNTQEYCILKKGEYKSGYKFRFGGCYGRPKTAVSAAIDYCAERVMEQKNG
jgi:hypothetical protein